MRVFDPAQMANGITSRYLGYLRSTFEFRDPDFRASFEQALNEGSLTKGPFLEITPGFTQGMTIPEMLSDLLGTKVDLGLMEALGKERRLYGHQDRAIRLVDSENMNVVVATGTGSGKTEAFLIPILTHLYREHCAGTLGSGVRALLLYPLNALANDQRRRLGEISTALERAGSSFRFTFGRYVGETPEDKSDRSRGGARHETDRLPGELVFRDEIRNTPPQILMTNYSMLEYLLLRPNDSDLFDAGRGLTWTFLVLDEAHQYRGSRGVEMALLVRRLKQRLDEGGCPRPLRCIATSATLAQGQEDAPGIAQFAADLFGEPFHPHSVVLAENALLRQSVGKRLELSDYDVLRDASEASSRNGLATISAVGRRLGVSLNPDCDVPTALGSVLVRDKRARRLMEVARGSPQDIKELGDQLFEDSECDSRSERLTALINLLAHARDPDSGAPLASARYHLLLRALDGIYLSYVPEKRVFLERGSSDDRGEVFEVGLCRECGQHYLLAGQRDLQTGRLSEPDRDPGSRGFGVRYLRPLDPEEIEQDPSDERTKFRSLCVECGCVGKDKPGCDHNHSLRVAVEPPPTDAERRDQISSCGRCEYSGTDPVREVVHGGDGPNVVVATAIFEGLSEKSRKILAFRDGRQEAAFFAWYAERTHKQFVRRAILLNVVQNLSHQSGGQLSLGDIAPVLREALRDAAELDSSAGNLEALREAWLDLYSELLTDQRRISLEGVGLLRWDIAWPAWQEETPRFLHDRLGLKKQEASDLAFLLLDTLRARGAVELATHGGIALTWGDMELRNQQTNVRIGPPRGDKRAIAWDGKQTNRSVLLSRVLQASSLRAGNSRDDAGDLLREFWKVLTSNDQRAPKPEDQLLLSVGDGKRLNPNWWRASLLDRDFRRYECTTCGHIHTRNVRNVCPRYRCPGILRQISDEGIPIDHYRMLYEQSRQRTLRAEEHTAQLETARARQVQRDFEVGNVNLLSCSTTFELGVDLGDLQTVFLRNVPPEPFNYVQRVGRAGRRTGRPGFAVTYCRRIPHDFYHFHQPAWMLNGWTRPPSLSLQNEKIVRRHMAAVGISGFLRDQRHRFGDVRELLGDATTPTLASDVANFLRLNEVHIAQHLAQVVPQKLHDQLGLCDGSWIEQVAGNESRLAEAESETQGDCLDLEELRDKASVRHDFQTAGWAQRRLTTIMAENALTYLSRKVVIPKYGFPVDVVELDLQRHNQSREARDVTLQRDLSIAISEYAPTAEVVAAKRVWRSFGLKRVPGRAWPRRKYRLCLQHHTFVQWVAGQDERPLPCGCKRAAYEYVEPRFGFITSQNQRVTEPRRRPQRHFTTRPFFAGLDRNSSSPILEHGVLNVIPAQPGTMVTLCEGRSGRGFNLCETCGAGFRSRKRRHETPFGQACDGRLGRPVALGHEFLTDIVQVDFLLPQHPAAGMDRLWFAYSMAYALAQGAAQTLDVPATDLSSTVRRRPSGDDYRIVLYDNVPGGAGLVARLSEIPVLTDVLREAHQRVGGACGCAETTSCYGCLRSFSNQFAHPNLQRGPVAAYLAEVLEKLLT